MTDTVQQEQQQEQPQVPVLVYPIPLIAAIRAKFLEDYRAKDVYNLVRAIDEVAERQGFQL